MLPSAAARYATTCAASLAVTCGFLPSIIAFSQ